jgi:hypothetical protein
MKFKDGVYSARKMALPKEFSPVKLICGVIYKEEALYAKVRDVLAGEWGRVDLESPAFPFDLTDYYEAEMGPGLVRRFMSFERLVPPESLPDLKRRTIEHEEALRREAGAAGRPANIDPGYLTASALIMATAKEFSHRVPLGRGIYAHLELLFTKTGTRALDWTYPDIRREACAGFLREVRAAYLRDVRRGYA